MQRMEDRRRVRVAEDRVETRRRKGRRIGKRADGGM